MPNKVLGYVNNIFYTLFNIRLFNFILKVDRNPPY